MRRFLVLTVAIAAAVVSLVLGAAGQGAVAGAAQEPIPPDARSTFPGEFVSVPCGPGLRIVDPVATYLDKHGNLVRVVTQPSVSAVNQYGDVVSAAFLTPKKAAYVVLSFTCAPLTQPTPTPGATPGPTVPTAPTP